MKKLFAVILALALALSCAAALAEAEIPTEEMPEAAAEYEGLWRNVDAEADITWEGLGFKVIITRPQGGGRETRWEYSCSVTDDNKLVALPLGLRVEVGDGSTEPVYEDGEAEFYFDEDGCLVWDNKKEGEVLEIGTVFQKVSPGDFDGYWSSDNTVIEMTFEEQGYRITIRQVDENANVTETHINGFYHEDDGTVVSFDGTEVFSKNDDGCLIWHGMIFDALDAPLDSEEADG